MMKTRQLTQRALTTCLWLFAVAFLVSASSQRAEAASIATTGGITLVADGPFFAAGDVPNNLALATNGATPFALDELVPNGIHDIDNLNDGLYGNSNSWIGAGATGSSGPFAGIALPSSQTVNSIAFGRDATGMFQDRSVGTYELQFTNVASPDETTPDGDWTSIGTISYLGALDAPQTTAAVRHQFTFTPVTATGVRLINPNTAIAIDEIELYNNFALPGATLIETGPIALTPASVPPNLATRPGATAFAKDLLLIGGNPVPAHAIAHINDGIYGNSNSWIGNTDYTFAGVDLGGTFDIDMVAFGRDNTNQFSDRDSGTFTLQYTTVPNPDATTPDSDWTTIDVFVYDGTTLPDATPHLRHLYEFESVAATGVRIITSAGGLNLGIAIDEIEVFAQVPEPATAGLTMLAIASLVGRRRRRA